MLILILFGLFIGTNRSSIVNNESIPDNIKYEYVAGQSYNILSFGKDYDLKSNESINIDFNQFGGKKNIGSSSWRIRSF